MNKVILMGRLTRDPEIRYSQSENSTAVARFTLAVDRRFKRDGANEQSADFISCVTFGKNAEFAESCCPCRYGCEEYGFRIKKCWFCYQEHGFSDEKGCRKHV